MEYVDGQDLHQIWSARTARSTTKRPPTTSPKSPTACSTPTRWAWSIATSSRPTAWSTSTDGEAARPGPGQAHRGRSLAHDGQRGKRARHGRLPGPRAGPQQPRGRRPLRHLQPGLHAVFPAHGQPAVSGGLDLRAAAEAPNGQAGEHLQGAARCAAVAGGHLRNDDGQEAGRPASRRPATWPSGSPNGWPSAAASSAAVTSPARERSTAAASAAASSIASASGPERRFRASARRAAAGRFRRPTATRSSSTKRQLAGDRGRNRPRAARGRSRRRKAEAEAVRRSTTISSRRATCW